MVQARREKIKKTLSVRFAMRSWAKHPGLGFHWLHPTCWRTNYVKQVHILYVSTGKLEFPEYAFKIAMLVMNSSLHRMLVIHCELRTQRATLVGTIRMHYSLHYFYSPLLGTLDWMHSHRVVNLGLPNLQRKCLFPMINALKE